MRWPWRRNNDEAQAELEDAKRKLAAVRDQWPAVHGAAAAMRLHRERNHFAENIERIYAERGRR